MHDLSNKLLLGPVEFFQNGHNLDAIHNWQKIFGNCQEETDFERCPRGLSTNHEFDIIPLFYQYLQAYLVCKIFTCRTNKYAKQNFRFQWSEILSKHRVRSFWRLVLLKMKLRNKHPLNGVFQNISFSRLNRRRKLCTGFSHSKVNNQSPHQVTDVHFNHWWFLMYD